MANFLPMQSSPFGEMQLYTPDWSFLTQVMGTKQAEYDRGHKIVKTHFDQLKNSALSNPETEEQREYYFKQLENNLKSIANLDLSKRENINRALEIMKPISEDKAIAYDMAYTAAMNRERAKMESIKNSTDPEIRKQYNKYSELEMNYADMRMREAHIDDGSIFDVRPVAHVNFKNFIDDLDKKMKDLGISVKLTEATGDGYMIETKNGPMSIPYFNMWAQMQMGDEYDEIFDVMSRVQLETGIRNTMQAEGVNRNEAMRIIAEKYSPILVAKEAEKELAFNEEYNSKILELNMFKKELLAQGYPQGQMPKDKVNEYNSIVNELENLEKEIEKVATNKIDAQDPEYLISNLQHFFSNDTKDRQVEEWATSTAMVTAEQNIKSDDVWLTKYKEAGINRRHIENLNFEKQKHADNLALKEKELEQKTLGASNGKNINNNSNSSTFTKIGPGISKGVLYKPKVLNDAIDKARANIHNVAISSNHGVLGLLTSAYSSSDESYLVKLSEYQNVLDSLYDVSTGTITVDKFKSDNPNFREILNRMVLDLDLKKYLEIPINIANRSNATDYLELVYQGLYKKSNDVISTFPDNININFDLQNGLTLLRNSMEESISSIDNYYKYWDDVRNITSGMMNADNLLGRTPNGNYILDGNALEDHQIELLNNAMSREIVSGVPEVIKYNVSNLDPNIIKILLQPSNIKPGSIEGFGDYSKKKINKNYEKDVYDKYFRDSDSNSLSKTFGNNLDVSYDITTDEFNFSLKTDNSINKGDKGSIQFSVDKSTIYSNPLLRETFAHLADNVKIPTNINHGEYQSLVDKDNSYVQSSESDKAMGFQSVVKANKDGTISIEIGLENGGKWEFQELTLDGSVLENDIPELKSKIEKTKYDYLASKRNQINSKPKRQEDLVQMTR